MTSHEALVAMLENQRESFNAVKLAITDIEKTTKLIVNNLLKFDQSRIIYIGAGTSGRIGVQDGVELYPTFGWPKNRIDYVIAGGLSSLTSSVEGAEDDENDAVHNVKKLNIIEGDIVIGLSASGNTPFVIKALKEAKSFGALTIGICNNFNQKIQKISDLSIVLDTGVELIAGSTRLKAGSAQKICLNMISTLCMTKLGKVKDGLMINMVPTNDKLIKRMTIINSLK